MAPSESLWTRGGLVAYLGALAPLVLVVIGGALGWSIAPREHLRPTPANVAAGVAALVAGIAIVRSRWGNQHAALRSATAAPEFGPPEGLRPAEVDLLLHAVARPRDVAATIVDLALRGFLRIDEAKTDDGQPIWTFERAAGPLRSPEL